MHLSLTSVNVLIICVGLLICFNASSPVNCLCSQGSAYMLGKIFIFFFLNNSKKSIVTSLDLLAILCVYNANMTNTFSNWLQFIPNCDSNILDCTYHCNLS
jgi:hypothetical protein